MIARMPLLYTAMPMHERSLRALITAAEMRAFSRPSGWRVARDLTLIWVQIVAGGALYVLYPAWWTYVPAFVLIAGGQHGLSLATHEFAHYSLMPARRRLNDLLGGWLFGAPVGLPLAIFRYRHFEHHRTFSTDEDTKTIYRHSLRGVRLFGEIARGLIGWQFLDHKLVARAQHARNAAAGSPGPSVAGALPPLLAAQGAVALVFTLVASPWLYLTLWLLPLVTLAQLLHTIRAIIEHRPLEERMGVEPRQPLLRRHRGPVRPQHARELVGAAAPSASSISATTPNTTYGRRCRINTCPLLRERLEQAGAFGDARFDREDSYSSALRKLWRPAAAGESR